MKTCAACNTEKPLSEFYKDPRPARKSCDYRGSCKPCVNKQGKKWYEANKDKRKISVDRWDNENKESIAERKKLYYLANRDEISEKTRKYRASHPEKMRLRFKKYYENNKEKHRASVKSWGDRNPDSLRAFSQKRRCAEKNAEGSFSASDIQRIFEVQFGMCTGCGDPLESSGGNKYHVDHVMPISLGGSNWPSNLQLLCPRCNHSKNAKHPDLWNKIKPLTALKKKK